MNDPVPHCAHENRERRFVSKPVGSFSLSGMEVKFSVIEIEVCDECWAQILRDEET